MRNFTGPTVVVDVYIGSFPNAGQALRLPVSWSKISNLLTFSLFFTPNFRRDAQFLGAAIFKLQFQNNRHH